MSYIAFAVESRVSVGAVVIDMSECLLSGGESAVSSLNPVHPCAKEIQRQITYKLVFCRRWRLWY